MEGEDDRRFAERIRQLCSEEIARVRQEERERVTELVGELRRENASLRQQLTRFQPANHQNSSPEKIRGGAPNRMNTFSGVASLGEIPALRSHSISELPFDKLPTQYSDDESVQRSSPVKMASSPRRGLGGDSMGAATQYTDSSPAKREERHESISGAAPDLARPDDVKPKRTHEEVAPPTTPTKKKPRTIHTVVPPIVGPHTILQRREFVHKYYRDRYSDTNDMVNLSINPITEQMWIISDFRPNPSYVKPTGVDVRGVARRMGLTRKEEDKRKRFYALAGEQKEMAHRADDDSEDSPDEVPDSYDDKVSQMFDKFASPPGFMVSEFPGTQEDARRRKIIERRQQRRIQRRVRACVAVKQGRQVGEYIFRHDVLNWYVVADRWYVE